MIFQFVSDLRKLSDCEVMLLIQKGRERAFNEMYRRYARRLQGFFYRMCGQDRELAADFTQEIFERIWTCRDRYKAGENVDAWLFTMAYNICRNEYRHREVKENYEWYLQGSDEASDPDVESRLDAEAFDNALADILITLPPEPRMLFALRYEEELSFPEIAEIMHVPLGTVKSRNHHLVAFIKQKLHRYERNR